MHRKFIILIVAAAIAVTGFSTQVRARDKDLGKMLAGLVVLGIIGAAIRDSNKNDAVVSTRSPEPDYYQRPHQHAHQPAHQHARQPAHQPGHQHAHQPGHRPHVNVTPRPKPPYVARKTLPRSCLGKAKNGRGKKTKYLGGKCLKKTYGNTRKLPRSCKERVWNRNGSWSGYNVQCLKNYGYRISHK